MQGCPRSIARAATDGRNAQPVQGRRPPASCSITWRGGSGPSGDPDAMTPKPPGLPPPSAHPAGLVSPTFLALALVALALAAARLAGLDGLLVWHDEVYTLVRAFGFSDDDVQRTLFAGRALTPAELPVPAGARSGPRLECGPGGLRLPSGARPALLRPGARHRPGARALGCRAPERRARAVGAGRGADHPGGLPARTGAVRAGRGALGGGALDRRFTDALPVRPRRPASTPCGYSGWRWPPPPWCGPPARRGAAPAGGSMAFSSLSDSTATCCSP